MEMPPNLNLNQLEKYQEEIVQKINRLYITDKFTVIFWIILMWVVLAGVNFVILNTFGQSYKLIALASGIGVGIFCTIGSLVVLSHLKHNKHDLYYEDLQNSNQLGSGKKKITFALVFDVLLRV